MFLLRILPTRVFSETYYLHEVSFYPRTSVRVLFLLLGQYSSLFSLHFFSYFRAQLKYHFFREPRTYPTSWYTLTKPSFIITVQIFLLGFDSFKLCYLFVYLLSTCSHYTRSTTGQRGYGSYLLFIVTRAVLTAVHSQCSAPIVQSN